MDYFSSINYRLALLALILCANIAVMAPTLGAHKAVLTPSMCQYSSIGTDTKHVINIEYKNTSTMCTYRSICT